jgi:hypothetical protein
VALRKELAELTGCPWMGSPRARDR